MVQYCAVPGCRNSALIPGISFHTFPQEPRLKKIWEIKIKRDRRRNKAISSSMRVCSEHFLKSDFRVTSTGTRKCLKKNAIPSVFSFYPLYDKIPSRLHCAAVTNSIQRDTKVTRIVENIKLKTKEKAITENFVCGEYYLEENKEFNAIKLANIHINKIKEIPVFPGVSQLNLHSYITENISERKLLTGNPTSKVERLDSKSLTTGILDKENADCNSVKEQDMHTEKKCFTYEKLIESISLIKRPNLWWSVSSAHSFIICARWNNEYIAVKRVVIESNLTIRVFLKEMEINITGFMDINCIDDISNLLQKVENYETLTGNGKL